MLSNKAIPVIALYDHSFHRKINKEFFYYLLLSLSASTSSANFTQVCFTFSMSNFKAVLLLFSINAFRVLASDANTSSIFSFQTIVVDGLVYTGIGIRYPPCVNSAISLSL